jgi:hypothetical protein
MDVHSVGFLENWGVCDFQFLSSNPHKPQQPIETSQRGFDAGQNTFLCLHNQGCRSYLSADLLRYLCEVHPAKLYRTKTPIPPVADLLNDHVLPFVDEQGIPVIRVLADRGAVYCCKPEFHDYQLYLALNDIGDTKTTRALPRLPNTSIPLSWPGNVRLLLLVVKLVSGG